MVPSKSSSMANQEPNNPAEQEKELNEDFARLVEAGYEDSLSRNGQSEDGFVDHLERQTEQNRTASFQYQLLDRTRRVWATNILVAINVVIYIVQLTQGIDWLNPQRRPLLNWGANYAPLTFAGEWWRLISCMFLHGGILHLLMNMYSLKMLGNIIERIVGTWSFLALYILTGIAGSLTSLYWNSSETVSVGASGGICGIFGVLIGYVFWQRHSFPPMFVKAVRSATVLVVVLTITLGYFIENVDQAAHLGGTVLGVLIGFFLSQPFGSFEKSKARNHAIALGLIGIIATVIAVKTFPEVPVDVIALQEKRIISERELISLYRDRADTSRMVFDEFFSLSQAVKQHKIPMVDAIEILENKIISPWKEILDRFEALDDISENHRDRVKIIKKSMHLRLDVWESYKEILEAQDYIEKDKKVDEWNKKRDRLLRFDKLQMNSKSSED